MIFLSSCELSSAHNQLNGGLFNLDLEVVEPNKGSEDAGFRQFGKEGYLSNLLVKVSLHKQVNVKTLRKFTFSKGTQSP